MTYIILILIPLVLVIGFFVLTWYEGTRGVRLFAIQRTRFDEYIERIEFILTHINLGAFLQDEARRLTARVGHDIAHLSLIAVRAAERVLTRLVRYLRIRHEADTQPRESVREFVKTLSDFKGDLEATRPAREQDLSELP